MNNKNVLLTGATGGIGCALAEKLANRGATLFLVGRNEQKLAQLATQLQGEHQIIRADLNTRVGREQVLKCVCNNNTKLDFLINAAGVSNFTLLEDSADSAMEQAIQSNLISPMLLTQILLPQMNKRGSKIINIGSTFGHIGYPGFSSYCASKFGLRGFSQALSRELGDSAIEVQYVAPRATKTSMNGAAVDQLNQRMGNNVDSPQDLADQIIKAMSTKKFLVAIGWPEKLFIFLNNIASPLVDLAINKKLATIKQYAKGV